MAQLHAVLTGDLIHSTRGTPAQLDDTMALIEAAAHRFSDEARFHRYRGDGWQVYVGAAGRGLGAMIYIAARLIQDEGLASRIALGIGDAQGLAEPTLASAGGGAFVASGRALDAMTGGRRLALAGAVFDPLHHALMASLDAQVQGWSPQQAEAVAWTLTPGLDVPQQALADMLGISRQAFAARLNAAGFALIEQAIRAFATHFTAEASHG
ncbi:hypothetical protein [Pseudotabrizicola sp.]|uniref:hypothetical protein n=1 Tax=Pseudotabrizicola sp. TaxID=2939647 RepID=UPI00271E1AF8|nr:hypothetical protein [Pseudotabrizicola sp.]MDO8881897.1 hypothetical protein [Pseudotabrizicola sp.]